MSRTCGSSAGSCIAERGRVGGAASSAVARLGDSVTGCRQHAQRTHAEEQFSCSDADSTGPHGSGRSISAMPLTSKARTAKTSARMIRFTSIRLYHDEADEPNGLYYYYYCVGGSAECSGPF